MASTTTLGGRLALLPPTTLAADRRKLYAHLQATEIAWSRQQGFEGQTAGGELIGPYNAMLRSPEIAMAFLGAVGAVGQHSTLSNAVRQVIILTVGAAWQAAYELYAHEKVAQQAELSAAAIRALAAGQPPVELSAAESLAHELTQQVTTAHQLSPDLYQRGVEAFGEKGLVELLVLAGLYMTVSALLNAFEVPAPSAA